MKLRIWQKYFFAEALKLILFFISCFYLLYVLIDYSSHSRTFHHYIDFKWYQIALYYLSELSNRLDILLPFAILVATIRTVYALNIHNELVALMAGGVPLKRLMTPFLAIGFLGAGTIYLNYQFVQPFALQQIRQLDDMRSEEKIKKQNIQSVESLVLEDGSSLIYLDYDRTRQRFFDAYWIRSTDDIYRIRYLYPYTKSPEGHFVERFRRQETGELQIADSWTFHSFQKMRFNKKKLLDTLTPPEELALSTHWQKLPKQREEENEKEAILISAFYRKLLMPWFCLLAVIGPIPFCVRFSRQQPIFFVYAFSLFGLVATHLVLDSAVILGKKQIFAPEYIILIPFLLLYSLLGWRYSTI